ncbi:protease complex subunit PrcB family protein [Aureitalea marina]|uniref:PrcB C-terminal domain-containing protein n=1 Tax=Aureitalea marina TaxID=930804 RepID=A0A2S7KP66_9FLAO|nr:protease complex subunit PrcB family protein [Aureitalea marina]PQB04363.1 hypothetical protein BST85_05220 [Aureitalea marina]
MFRNLTLLFLGLTLSVQAQQMSNMKKGDPVEFEVIMQDAQSNNKRQDFSLISSSSDLLKVVGMANMGRAKSYKLPQVDFAKYSMVFINLGEQNSGGIEVHVKKVVDTGSEWIVYYQIDKPGADEMATTVMTTPFTLVRIPRPGSKVSFEEITAQR